MKDFRNLAVWQKAHDLTLEVSRVTALFPSTEKYALVSQFRRASTSIGLNIAEGSGRGSAADFKRFLQVSYGSACEVEYCIILSTDLGFMNLEQQQNLLVLVSEIQKMLAAYMRKLV